jgi:hypothetical protein
LVAPPGTSQFQAGTGDSATGAPGAGPADDDEAGAPFEVGDQRGAELSVQSLQSSRRVDAASRFQQPGIDLKGMYGGLGTLFP